MAAVMIHQMVVQNLLYLMAQMLSLCLWPERGELP